MGGLPPVSPPSIPDGQDHPPDPCQCVEYQRTCPGDMVDPPGFEPGASRLRVGRSTAELRVHFGEHGRI